MTMPKCKCHDTGRFCNCYTQGLIQGRMAVLEESRRTGWTAGVFGFGVGTLIMTILHHLMS